MHRAENTSSLSEVYIFESRCRLNDVVSQKVNQIN